MLKKTLIFSFFLIVLSFSVFALGDYQQIFFDSANSANQSLDINGKFTNESIHISEDVSVYGDFQPVVHDWDSDGYNEVIVFSDQSIKVYSHCPDETCQGKYTLEAETFVSEQAQIDPILIDANLYDDTEDLEVIGIFGEHFYVFDYVEGNISIEEQWDTHVDPVQNMNCLQPDSGSTMCIYPAADGKLATFVPTNGASSVHQVDDYACEFDPEQFTVNGSSPVYNHLSPAGLLYGDPTRYTAGILYQHDSSSEIGILFVNYTFSQISVYDTFAGDGKQSLLYAEIEGYANGILMDNNYYCSSYFNLVTSTQPRGFGRCWDLLTGELLYDTSFWWSGNNTRIHVSNPVKADIDADHVQEVCWVFDTQEGGDSIRCMQEENYSSYGPVNISGVRRWPRLTSGSMDNDIYADLIFTGGYYLGGVQQVVNNTEMVDNDNSGDIWALAIVDNDLHPDLISNTNGNIRTIYSENPKKDTTYYFVAEPYGYYTKTCINTTNTIKGFECQGTEQGCTYVNENSDAYERFCTTCAGTQPLSCGDFSTTQPEIECSFSTPGTYNIDVILQDDSMTDDYSTGATIQINVTDSASCDGSAYYVSQEDAQNTDGTTTPDIGGGTEVSTEDGPAYFFDTITGGNDMFKLIIGMFLVVLLMVGMAKHTHNAAAIIATGGVGFIIGIALGLIPVWILIIGILGGFAAFAYQRYTGASGV